LYNIELTTYSVILMAILRLWSGLKYDHTPTMYDFTWWMPEVLIFSCLEVDFAIMCASMPIFWPSVMAAWTEIFVTNEVTVVSDRRSLYIEPSMMEMELASPKKSHESTIGLTRTASDEHKPTFTVFDPERRPDGGRAGVSQVEVQPGAGLRPARWI
jgi:hypothetical protein